VPCAVRFLLCAAVRGGGSLSVKRDCGTLLAAVAAWGAACTEPTRSSSSSSLPLGLSGGRAAFLLAMAPLSCSLVDHLSTSPGETADTDQLVPEEPLRTSPAFSTKARCWHRLRVHCPPASSGARRSCACREQVREYGGHDQRQDDQGGDRRRARRGQTQAGPGRACGASSRLVMGDAGLHIASRQVATAEMRWTNPRRHQAGRRDIAACLPWRPHRAGQSWRLGAL
jgi:hypothetical protein